MSSKHKRTKACEISIKTKRIVYERDGGRCIFCKAPGLPEAHIVPRSHGGLGCEENIVTVCRKCHDELDNSIKRKEMLKEAAAYLKGFYPEWKKEKYIFDKWHKDKGGEGIKNLNNRNHGDSDGKAGRKSHKDKGEPPDGFYLL